MPSSIAREDFGVHCSGKIVLERRPLDLTGLSEPASTPSGQLAGSTATM